MRDRSNTIKEERDFRWRVDGGNCPNPWRIRSFAGGIWSRPAGFNAIKGKQKQKEREIKADSVVDDRYRRHLTLSTLMSFNIKINIVNFFLIKKNKLCCNCFNVTSLIW
jgi:hypothetical protein